MKLVYKAMSQYNQTLVERAALIQELLHFKRQNNELTDLLDDYANSNLNRELCLPPPRIF